LDKDRNVYRSSDNGRTFLSMKEVLEKKASDGIKYGGPV